MNDFRFALRQLRKSSGFTSVAIATLALGIGACTAIFSLVDAVVLRPLPFREPSRLVWIENNLGQGLSARTSRADTFNSWREQNTSFEALAAYFAFSDFFSLTWTGGGDPQRLRSVGVSDNFLPVLGVPLLHGRNFSAEECAWNGPGAAILSHRFWQTRFSGDSSVIGRSITLNNKPTAIIGILPPTFEFSSIFTPGSEVDILTPFPLVAETAQWGNSVFGIGRLNEGVSREKAQAELAVISQRLQQLRPEVGAFGAVVSPLDDMLRGKFRAAFWVLAGAVFCVLAIACVNLSNLLLARLNARRQEFAVRIALGASRYHLVRQTLTESLLLAFAGSFIAVPLAMWGTAWLAQLKTFGIPLLQSATVNPAALAVMIGLTAFAGVACGVLPSIQLTRPHAGSISQQASHQRTTGQTAATARDSLVVAEVALACILLIAAGLLIRSFGSLLRVDLGFQPQHAMVWRLSPAQNFKNLAEANAYFDTLVARVAATPGVTAVGLSDTLPLGRNRGWGAGAKGVSYRPGEYPTAYPRIADDGYLQAMQIPLRLGRFFDGRDHGEAKKTIIINENLAHRLWADRSPLDEEVEVNGEARTVIGVVANVRHSSLEETGGNEMYLNNHQCADWSAVEMVVRSFRTPASLVPDVHATIARFDPTLPNGEYYPVETLIDRAVAPRRLITALLGSFSILALTLAALGLYGVIAQSVIHRTKEIGIRMAIGAQQKEVLGLIMRGSLKLVAVGVAVGLFGAFVLTRLLQNLLFGVTPYDPVVFLANILILFGVASLACYFPARRATRVDPISALRAE